MWCVGAVKAQIYQNMNKFQKVNHFPRSIEMTWKDFMTLNIKRLIQIHPKDFEFFPTSYVLPEEFEEAAIDMNMNPEKWFIIKPSAAAQGKGIIFIDHPSKIPRDGLSYMMSHYVNDPYLINGYKFDLWIYVGITSVNPLWVYVYEEGLVWFATAKYQPISESLDEFQRYTHLTNYAVNKKNANFIENTDATEDDVGSKWSLAALWKHFKSLDIDPKMIWDQIDDVIIKTIITAEHHMNKAFAEQVLH